MSDKFFDKDNNFILWKDKGDLTEASKYVGDNRSSIGVGESLATKIAKGKVDIGRTFDSSGNVITNGLTVNWGKCGGSSDVIVTYGENEPLWVPYAFIRNAFDSSLVPKTNIFDKQVGYQGLLGDKHISGYDEAIYKLPSNIGPYLYANAETGSGYGGDGNSSNLYKGIAFYPDTVSNWEKSATMGIGIRKKSDIGKYSTIQSAVTVPTTVTSNLEDDAYYLVAQLNKTTADNIIVLNGHLKNCFPLTSDSGTDHLYLRHWVDMDDVPSATNMGEKYTCPSELCSDVTTYTETKDSIGVNVTLPTPNEDQVVIDWGGGLKTYYKYGEPMYVPRAFLDEGFTEAYASNMSSDCDPSFYGGKFAPVEDNIGNHLGYQTWFGIADRDGRQTRYQGGISSWFAIYRLPDELGEYLYNCAETQSGNVYGSNSNLVSDLYKGIAIYPDNPSEWTMSRKWYIGIRKKSDLLSIRMNGDTPTSLFNGGDYSCISNYPQYKALDDNAHYLVIWIGHTLNDSLYIKHKGYFPKDEPIWLRHWKGMTANPSPTNMGKKMVYHPEYGKSVLGGKIFYIDPSDNGATYKFYDEDYNEVTGWSTVADLTNAKYYSVKGTPSKDKVYVYYPTKYSSLKWWNNTSTTTGATGTAIGTGKTNTSTVMSRSDLPTSETIWNKLSEIRTLSGIDDWFVPSKDEADKLRESNLEDWHSVSPWASSETSASNARVWLQTSQRWSTFSKSGTGNAFFTRAF